MREKKYINGDRLSKQISDTRLNLPHDSKDFFTRDFMLLNFQQTIDLEPAADVVEVVRCKDCKYWDNVDVDYKGNPIKTYAGECQCSQWENEYYRYATTGNDFCSYGERADI